MSTELFPAHLLVGRDGERVFTTSLKVAEHFGKRHSDVLRAVERLLRDLPTEPKSGLSDGAADLPAERKNALSEGVTYLDFEPSEYRDATGRPLPMYRLSHDGFALLAMGFTGKEALAWKVRFLAAFRDLERQLQAAREREKAWYRDHAAHLRAAWYADHPLWRELAIAEALGETRAQTARRVARHPATVTRNLRRMRQVGLLPPIPQGAARRRAQSPDPETQR